MRPATAKTHFSNTLVAGLTLFGLVAAMAGGRAGAAQVASGPAFNVETASSDSHDAALSADGRYVVFVSAADNLVPADRNVAFDVFVRDRALGRTILVSVNSLGTAPGNGPSFGASISADGRFVAFESSASDLAPNDANNAPDVFLRDLLSGTTTLVSIAANGVASGNQASSWPVMTPDARFILFESRASNLAANDANNAADLFVRDLISNSTELVTRDRFGSASALGGGPAFAEPARISDDGRWVAFSSAATNLVANDTNQKIDVFVRDLLNRTNIAVSVATNGVPANNHSGSPALSADGRYVAFRSAANNLVVNTALVTNNVYVRDLQLKATTLVSANLAGTITPTNNSFSPAISADGRYVAFLSLGNDLVPDDTPPTAWVPSLDVFVRDMQMGVTSRVSVHTAQTTGNWTYSTNWTKAAFERSALALSISRDGRFVLFQSDGVDESLTNGDGSTPSTVVTTLPGSYVFDRATGSRTRIRAGLFPALSEDGRILAFQAAARDQLPGDPSAAVNIFVLPLAGGATELISRREASLDTLTGESMSLLMSCSLSADGRFLAFESAAGDLVANDRNGTSDLFVRDLIAGTNELVSLSEDLGGSSRGPSRMPVLSRDGRWVAFETVAGDAPLTNGLNNQFLLMAYDRVGRTNLVIARVGPDNKPGAPATPVWSADGRWMAFRSSWPDPAIPNSVMGQVYFRDLAQDTNVLVSLNQLGSAGGSGPSWNPLMDTSGTRVLFLSTARDLTTNTVSGTNLILWNAATRTRTLVSVAADGSGLNAVNQAALTSDGHFAVFLNRTNLYFCDLLLSSLSLIASNASASALSDDGQFVAFVSPDAIAGNDVNSAPDVFVFDRASNAVALASVNLGGTGSGNRASVAPTISRDGRYVIFTSQASDLAANDTNGFTDVFLRDRVAGSTLLLSAPLSGAGAANRLSGNPVLSADGNTVVFESYSSDIAAGDFNGAKDLFVVRLSAGDSDGDGMADNWEVAYFGNLSRDGTGDFDGDGQSDLAEYRAGTNPTDNGSLFLAYTRTGPDVGAGVMVLWNAVAGRTYRVQFKDALEQPDWSELPGDIVATSTTGTRLDPSAQYNRARFYRVVAVQ